MIYHFIKAEVRFDCYKGKKLERRLQDLEKRESSLSPDQIYAELAPSRVGDTNEEQESEAKDPTQVRQPTKDSSSATFHDRPAARLYSICINVMKHLCKFKPIFTSDANPEHINMNKLKEARQKFFLWGEDFGDGRLDKALERSDDSKEVVMELLSDIGYILTGGKLDLPFVSIRLLQ